MGDFNRDNRQGGNRGFGKRSFGSDRPQMHQATCANCGKSCEVPFRPNGSKPVYCSDCFKTIESVSPRRSDDRNVERPRFNRDDNPRRPVDQPNYKAQFETLNAKMDKILALLTPQQAPVVPVESIIDETVIEEFVEEIEVEKPKAKEKKVKAAKKKSPKKK